MLLFEPEKICTRRTAYALTAVFLLVITGRAALESRPAICHLTARASEQEIQRALDDLPGRGEVVLAPGIYDLSEPLFLRHDFETLRGSGTDTILRVKDRANCPAVVIGPPMDESGPPSRQAHLADLMIDGNRSHQGREFWRSAADGSMFNNNGVEIWNANEASITHVTCFRCRSGGLVSAGARRLEVNDFTSFDNQYDGLACYATRDSHFSGLHLHDNVAAGISLDLSFNHNAITNAVLERNDLGIFMRCSCSNSFRSVHITQCRHHGVFMAQTAVPARNAWVVTPGTECLGNDFENLVISDCNGRAFQVNDASCVGNTISGALFSHNRLGGLGQPASKPVTIHELAGR